MNTPCERCFFPVSFSYCCDLSHQIGNAFYTMQLFAGWKWFETREFCAYFILSPSTVAYACTKHWQAIRQCAVHKSKHNAIAIPTKPNHIILSIRCKLFVVQYLNETRCFTCIECRFCCVSNKKEYQIERARASVCVCLVHSIQFECSIFYSQLP